MCYVITYINITKKKRYHYVIVILNIAKNHWRIPCYKTIKKFNDSPKLAGSISFCRKKENEDCDTNPHINAFK